MRVQEDVLDGKTIRKNPVFYLPEIGRIRRVVENLISRIKRPRQGNTRQDRISETYMAVVSLAAITDWVRL